MAEKRVLLGGAFRHDQGPSLDDCLGAITVHQIDQDVVDHNKREHNKDISALLDLYVVNDGKRDVGYFQKESDAFGYRLFLINIRLNYRG